MSAGSARGVLAASRKALERDVQRRSGVRDAGKTLGERLTWLWLEDVGGLSLRDAIERVVDHRLARASDATCLFTWDVLAASILAHHGPRDATSPRYAYPPALTLTAAALPYLDDPIVVESIRDLARAAWRYSAMLDEAISVNTRGTSTDVE